MSRRQIIVLVLVLFLGLAVRVAMIPKNAADPLQGDENGYDTISCNLASGNGYVLGNADAKVPTAGRGPTYVLVLAAMYRVAGHNFIVPLVFQAILEAISCLLIFAISRLLFRRVDIGLTAAFLYAVYPTFIIHTGLLITEILVNFLVILAIYGFLRYHFTGKRHWLYVSAAAVVLGTLSKPILLMFPILFALAVRSDAQRRRIVIDLVVQCVIIGLIMSPWVIRNSLVFHKFIPVVTQGGFTFWGGTGPADGRAIGGLGSKFTPAYVCKSIKGMNEPQKDKWFYEDGFRIIKEHPGRYAVLVLKKIPRLWFNLLHEDPPSKASVALAAYNFIMIVLAFLGIYAYKPPREAHRLLLLLVVYYTIVHMVFFSVVRYSMPVYAYMFCFSAAGIIAIVERFAARNRLVKAILVGKRSVT